VDEGIWTDYDEHEPCAVRGGRKTALVYDVAVERDIEITVRGSCGLYIVTIINKLYARNMYIRTEETLLIPTDQNQQSRPEKEITLGIGWQKRQWKSEEKEEGKKGTGYTPKRNRSIYPCYRRSE
jgi:hypothetical protein